VVFHWGGASHRALISDAAFVPTSLLAAALAWSVAARRQVEPRARRAWRLIATAWACYWAGEMGWFYFDVVRHAAPFPSAADAAYAHQSLASAYTDGNWVDAAWMLAQLAAILSALAPAGAVSEEDLAPGRARVSRLPYAAVGIAFGLLVLVAYQHADGPLAGL